MIRNQGGPAEATPKFTIAKTRSTRPAFLFCTIHSQEKRRHGWEIHFHFMSLKVTETAAAQTNAHENSCFFYVSLMALGLLKVTRR